MKGDGRPEVTVSNPADPRPAGDVFEPVPRSSRRPLLIVLAAVVLFGAVTGVTNVRERQTAEVVERELAAAVQLELQPFDGGFSVDGDGVGDGAVVMRLNLDARNAGPGSVTVLRASLGDFASDSESQVAPGAVLPVRLKVRLDCREVPAQLSADGPVLVDVRTGDGAKRTVDLGELDQPLFLDAGFGRRLCGFLTPAESLAVDVERSQLDGDELRIRIRLYNSGREPVVVQELTVADGLGVRLEPNLLPLTLPSSRIDGVVASAPAFDAVVSVERCLADGQSPQGEQAGLLFTMAGDPAPGGVSLSEIDELLARACSDN